MPSHSSRSRRVWDSLTAFGPHGDAHWVALRAGVCLGAPLLLLWSLDRLDLALPATFGAFTALYGRANAHRSRAVMQATAAVVLVLAVAAGSTLAVTGADPWAVVIALAATAALAMLVSIVWAWHPPGALFPVFAVGATASSGASGTDAVVHTAVAAAVAVFSLAVGASGLLTPARHRPHQPWQAPGRIAIRSPMARDEILRVTLAVGLAAAAATALGLGHAYWASVGAAAATSGPSTDQRINRGLHRAVGTLAGIFVAAALLALDLGSLNTILVVIALQVGAELLVGRNYAAALVLITPLALLMVHLGSTSAVGTLLADRLADTLLGVLVGLLIVLAWDRWLSRQQRGSR